MTTCCWAVEDYGDICQCAALLQRWGRDSNIVLGVCEMLSSDPGHVTTCDMTGDMTRDTWRGDNIIQNTESTNCSPETWSVSTATVFPWMHGRSGSLFVEQRAQHFWFLKCITLFQFRYSVTARHPGCSWSRPLVPCPAQLSVALSTEHQIY